MARRYGIGYFAYIMLFALIFLTLIALDLHHMDADVGEVEAPGGVTGAVTVSGDMPAARPMPMINWAILLVSMSLGVSLLVLRHVHKASRYKN